ncbi:MAG: hypothetical protein Q8M08_05685 [Bacteroidales bacterium]|nr:hypothetical protein [Bacteroidales bacterium]
MKRDFRELVIVGKKEIAKLERFVEEICDYYNINNEYFGNVLLATTEAANIMFALNESSEKGCIVISFDRNPKGLVFRIKLKNGVDETTVNEDILDREIRKHKLARDIFIIKALTDEIEISVNARSIILVFYVSSMNYEKSLQRINELKEYWSKKDIVIHKK